MTKQLQGLLLVGGKSSRMGTNKAQLVYRNDQAEWLRLRELMQEFCETVYLCCPEDQAAHYELPVVQDHGNGPLAAIADADRAHPGNAWLVVACDLPLLDRATLERLVSNRNQTVVGTYYTSVFDGKPEPLCAIYENGFFPKIQQAISDNQYCPRKLFIQHEGNALVLENPKALKNANTPAEKLEIEAILNQTMKPKLVTIRYFAQLKEIANVDSEELSTTCVTPAGLYEELQMKYQFPHKIKQLMIAINGDFSEWDTELKEGDEVVFIPPVAGG